MSQQKKRSTSIYLERDQISALSALADRTGIPAAQFIRAGVWQVLAACLTDPYAVLRVGVEARNTMLGESCGPQAVPGAAAEIQ